MTTNNKTDPRQALEVLFVKDHLPEGADAYDLMDHMREDAAAREHFDQLALASRELEQVSGEGRSSFERSFGEASFLGALDAMLEEEQGASNAAPTVSPTIAEPRREQRAEVIELSTWFKVKQAAPGLAAAAALLFSLLAISDRGVQPQPDEGFQARSATHTTRTQSVPAAPSLALFCVTREGGDGVVFRGEREFPFGVLACSKDSELKLAHETPTHRFTHVAVFGIDHRGELKWYGPSPASRDAVEVSDKIVASKLRPIGESIRLGVNHEPGKIRVHALFSDQPLDYGKLESLLAGKDRGQLFEEAQLDLSRQGVSTTSKTFDVTEAAR